jgi:hypothetical protein
MFEQDRVIVRLQQRVMVDSDILVCFLAGSYGRRTEDAYSDLDVGLVFADEARRDGAWRQRREFVRSVTPYVPGKSFDAGHVRPYLHIVLYSNGAKADFRYETQASLTPNPWDRDLRLLKDSQGWGAAYQAQCQQMVQMRPTLSSQELTALDERFWVMFWDVYRQVLRGDSRKPFTVYLELLNFTLPPLLQVLPPEDPAYAGLLNALYAPNDMRATAVHLRRLLDAYLAARAAIVRRLNLAFMPDSAFENQMKRVVERARGKT